LCENRWSRWSDEGNDGARRGDGIDDRCQRPGLGGHVVGEAQPHIQIGHLGDHLVSERTYHCPGGEIGTQIVEELEGAQQTAIGAHLVGIDTGEKHKGRALGRRAGCDGGMKTGRARSVSQAELAEYYRELLEEQAASELSVTEFAAEVGISAGTLYSWLVATAAV